ncbi:MAG: TlyA family RNA methyltransferase [Catonella sp.]|nr:TlyA family RNA methyltransferase [Catonella sp.]MDY6355695.1 TlyA family RNA methyltransferase [Catonella sp.]
MQNKVKKERLDVLLTELGYFESRERAKRAIMEGIVFVNDEREDKAGTTFPVDARIEVRGSKLKYVSRGGLKLEKAIVNYGLDLTGKICMDIGSSTGGFTDCMLQNGAVKVYAIDSGTNQLAYKLRVDDRVISMENTNFRYVTPEQIPDEIDFASVDVSFISLTKILPAALPLLSESAEMVCLIKPQFEAGREKVGKKGVVRDPKVHEEVLVNVMTFAASCKFRFKAVTFSPIKGPEGNIEYLLYMAKSDSKMSEEELSSWLNKVSELVKEAHGELDK